MAVNEQRKRSMGQKVIAAMGGDARDKTLAVLGLTFKPNTDDMRDSPSIAIIETLQDAGVRIVAYDPEGMQQANKLLRDVAYRAGPYEAVTDADAVVIVTEWDAFRALDLRRMVAGMKGELLVDLRNIYSRADAEAAGLTYVAVGR